MALSTQFRYIAPLSKDYIVNITDLIEISSQGKVSTVCVQCALLNI